MYNLNHIQHRAAEDINSESNLYGHISGVLQILVVLVIQNELPKAIISKSIKHLTLFATLPSILTYGLWLK